MLRSARRSSRLALMLGILSLPLLAALGTGPVMAQQALGIDPGRDCQTIRTCRFTRGGSYRGCLSSYICRVCRPVRTRCAPADIAAGRRVCHELACRWGG